MGQTILYNECKNLNFYAGVIEKKVVGDRKSSTDVAIFYFLNNFI